MSSATSFNAKCPICKNETLFSEVDCRTGENVGQCTVCGLTYSMRFRRSFGKNGRPLIYERLFLPLQRIFIEFRELKTDKLTKQFRLPTNISFDDLNALAFGTNEQQKQALEQCSVKDESQKCYICVCYLTKGRTKKRVRFNCIGNWIEPSKSRNPKAVIVCIGKRNMKRRGGFGVMSIAYKGNRESYYRVFTKQPSIPHILDKWSKLTESCFDPEHSYLTIVEKGEAVFLKGQLQELFEEGDLLMNSSHSGSAFDSEDECPF